MDRREFLKQIAAGSLATTLAMAAPRPGRKYTAAVIGSTGQGDYGHGLDVLFNGHPSIEVLAVADPDPAGRAKRPSSAAGPNAPTPTIRRCWRRSTRI